MRMMEMVRAAMPEPSKARERTTNLGIGSGQGQPVEAWLDESSPAGGRCYSGDKVANCATSQFSARSDYSLTGHDDVCFDV